MMGWQMWKKGPARLKANEAALAYLREVDSQFPPDIVERLRVEYDDRIRQLEVCASTGEIAPMVHRAFLPTLAARRAQCGTPDHYSIARMNMSSM